MLDFTDNRWKDLTGGYRTCFDPRPLLLALETVADSAAIWDELWGELHHQGDVGEASYASVPHIVRIHRGRGQPDWNPYALVAVIDLARQDGKNPGLPNWLKRDYFQAIQDLAEVGAQEILRAQDPEDLRAIFSIIALAKGRPRLARFLLEYSEDELLDIEKRANELDS
jgi:hypothetical protein